MALGPQIDVYVEAQTAAAVAKVQAASEAMEASLRSIDTSFRDFYNGERSKREAQSAGEENADSYGKGFAKGQEKNDRQQTGLFKRKLKLWGGLIAAFGESIGVALYGASGAIVSLGSSLISAISASAALVPIMVGLGGAIAAIVIGSQGVGDAFGAVNKEFAAAAKEGRAFNLEAEGIAEAMRGLAPSAQEFVVAFAGIRDRLAEIGNVVQQNLFAGLGAELTRLAQPGGLISSVGEAFADFAIVANGALKDVIAVLEGANIGKIFSDLVPAVQGVAGALAPLTDAFLDFVVTATPYATTLAEQFQKWAESLSDFTSSADGVTAIEGFLDRAVASLQSWLDLIGSAGRVIGSVLRIASSEGDSLVDSLTGVLDRFNAWLNTDAGSSAVTLFLENSSRILKALGPILDGLVGLFDKLVTPNAIARFEELAESIGKILPTIGSLLSIIGEVGVINIFADALVAVSDALIKSKLIDAVKELGAILGKSLQKVLKSIVDSGALEILGTALVIVADAIGQVLAALFSNEAFLTAFQEGLTAVASVVAALAPLIASLLPVLLNLVGPLTELLQLLPPLAELILALMPAIMLVVDAMVLWSTVSAAVMGAIAAVVGATIGAVVNLLTFLVDTITGAVVAAIEGLASAWRATTADISAFYTRNIAPIVAKFQGWAAAIGSAFSSLISGVTALWSGFTSGITSAWNDTWTDVIAFWNRNIATLPTKIKGWVDDIVGFFTGLPGRISSGLSGLFNAITDPFKRAWDKVNEYVGKITGAVSRIPGSGVIGNIVSGAFSAFAKGGLVDRPTFGLVGEAGREAIIPMDKPLNQIDPSVRAMAAMLRGKDVGRGRAGGDYGPRSVTNNSFVLNEVGDANATAQRVLNRLAVGI